MFGRLKRKPDPIGPFEFGHAVEIARPCAEVYGLIDWGDPRNAKRALGNKVERVGGAPERFRLWLDLVPGHAFEMVVAETVPGKVYAFETEVIPPIGRLASSRERYRLEPLGEGACRLVLTVSASFAGGLSDEAVAMEVMMMTAACENALAKLKLHAEQGVEAVHAFEARQMDALDD